MLLTFTASFSLLSAFVAALPHDSIVSTPTARQIADPTSKDCNMTCAAYDPTENIDSLPELACAPTFLQAEVGCLFCSALTLSEEASVKLYSDAKIRKCLKAGFPVSFNFQVPPDAQEIVEEFYRKSSSFRKKQSTFLALQIAGGHVGLVIVLVFSIISPNVRRGPEFISFCITWIFSSISYSINLYHRTEDYTIKNTLGFVSENKCLVQAALTNGAQVMTACSTMVLVVQLWIRLSEAVHGKLFPSPKRKLITTLVLLVSPYILFLAFFTPSIFVGRGHVIIDDIPLERALPTNFYCSIIGISPFLRALYGTTLGLLLATTVFDILIIVILYRYWLAFRHVQTKGGVSLSILLRVILFSIYRVAVAIACVIVLEKLPKNNKSRFNDPLATFVVSVPIWTDMLQAAIPLVAFFVLGINSDMLHTPMFWQKSK